MTIQVYESAKSPDLNRKASKGSSASVVYIALCDNGESASEATSAALSGSPIAVATQEAKLIRTSAKVNTLAPMNAAGVGSYEVTIEYEEDDGENSQERPEPGTWHYSMDTGSASHKIFTSLQEKYFGNSDGLSGGADYGKTIGWDGKQAKGVDVSVAAPEFSITVYYKPTAVTTELFADLSSHSYHTNEDDWHGFDAGTLLFIGASGNGDIPTVAGQRVKPIPITLKFLYSQNLTNIILQDDPPIVVPIKLGWDYLDVQYQSTDDGDGLTPKVKRWAVHKIYEEISFADSFGF